MAKILKERRVKIIEIAKNMSQQARPKEFGISRSDIFLKCESTGNVFVSIKMPSPLKRAAGDCTGESFGKEDNKASEG